VSTFLFRWNNLNAIALLCAMPLTAATGVPLQLTSVAVSEYESSAIPPSEDPQFGTGSMVFLSFRVAGFGQTDETGQVSLQYTIQAVDCNGNSFGPPSEGRYARRISREPGAPLPLIRTRLKVPEFAYPGRASFRITLTDRLSSETVYEEVPFSVQSDYPEPSGPFEILLPIILTSQDGPAAPPNPVFQPGSDVWLRFLLAGFQWHRERSQYDLSYGITVAAANGRIVLQVPSAAAESSFSEYRKAYVPAIASVRLERTIKPGPYHLIVTATDGVARAQVRADVPFRVE